jgi:hypothetical protein
VASFAMRLRLPVEVGRQVVSLFSRKALPRRYGYSEGLFGIVFLLIVPGCRLLIAVCHQVCCLIKRGFEHAKQLPVYLHKSALWMTALVVFEQPFMKTNVGKEQCRQDGAVSHVAARR